MVLARPTGGSTSTGVDTEKYTYWDIDCDEKRVRVFVNNLEIPTTFVQTHESREGPADYNQLAEVRFPAEWEGQSVVDEIDAFDPENYSGYDRVLIQRQNTQTGGWVDHQYGFVRNVGGTDQTGVLVMWVADPSMLTTGIEYGNSFESATGRDILSELTDTFTSETVFDSVESDIPGGELQNTGSDSSELLPGRRINVSSVDTNADRFSKSFKANQHTLADALDWLATVSDTNWWFDYRDGSLTLVFGRRSPAVWASDHVEVDGAGVIDIINNQALSEITPVNTVQVGGKTGKSVAGFHIKELSSEYPYARVEYPPLVKRAGQTVSDTFQQVDATTIQQAENIAKQKLRDGILSSGHGEITLKGCPQMEIGDEIHAIPECADRYIADVTPFTFQITDLEHTKKALEEYVTEATVAPRVNDDLIEITESRMKDQQNQ